MTEKKKFEVQRVIFGMRVNSFNRFDKFLYCLPIWANPKKWYAFSLAYTCSDNLYEYQPAIKQLLKGFQPRFRQYMMDDADIKAFNQLPKIVTIYRGMTEEEFNSGDFGVSWTLDKKVAEFFAHSYPRNIATNHLKKTVHSIEVKKSQIIALFNDRQESEVLYLHKKK